MNRLQILRRRITILVWLFILGLVLSGVTAIPLTGELAFLVRSIPPTAAAGPPAHWLVQVRDALAQTATTFPFLFYGTDWLAFGHFAIAIAFVGALREPVRNRWLFDFGLIACASVIPYAFVFGAWRGIPLWWRLIDCSFGLLGSIPLWLCRRWARELESGGKSAES